MSNAICVVKALKSITWPIRAGAGDFLCVMNPSFVDNLWVLNRTTYEEIRRTHLPENVLWESLRTLASDGKIALSMVSTFPLLQHWVDVKEIPLERAIEIVGERAQKQVKASGPLEANGRLVGIVRPQEADQRSELLSVVHATRRELLRITHQQSSLSAPRERTMLQGRPRIQSTSRSSTAIKRPRKEELIEEIGSVVHRLVPSTEVERVMTAVRESLMKDLKPIARSIRKGYSDTEDSPAYLLGRLTQAHLQRKRATG